MGLASHLSRSLLPGGRAEGAQQQQQQQQQQQPGDQLETSAGAPLQPLPPDSFGMYGDGGAASLADESLLDVRDLSLLSCANFHAVNDCSGWLLSAPRCPPAGSGSQCCTLHQ